MYVNYFFRNVSGRIRCKTITVASGTGYRSDIERLAGPDDFDRNNRCVYHKLLKP
jgi:hypothetical protein